MVEKETENKDASPVVPTKKWLTKTMEPKIINVTYLYVKWLKSFSLFLIYQQLRFFNQFQINGDFYYN